MWVDLAIIGILILFALESLGRSLVLETIDFVSFLLAFFLSFSYYNLTAKIFEVQLKIPHGLSQVAGFMSVWFLSEAIFFLLIKIVSPLVSKFRLPSLRFLSIIPALLRSLIFVALLLVMIATFPIQPQIKKAVLDSKIGSRILKNAYGLEQPVKNVFGAVSTDSLTFLTIKPQTDQRVNIGFQTSQFSVSEKEEREMVDLVNKERVDRGLKPLVFSEALRGIARFHSADMFVGGYFSHYSPEGLNVADRAIKAGIDFLVIGENLAYAPTLQSAHKGLMNSPGHRANILSVDFGKIGIGVMDGGIYEQMFTQVFTN